MPEYPEIIASAVVVNRFLERERLLSPFHLKAIYADATREESKDAANVVSQSPSQAAEWQTRASQDLVMCLGPESRHIARGTNGHQEYLWPRLADGTPISLSFMLELDLRSAQTTPRTIVLDMGEMTLQVRMHTHTMTQVFTRSQWDEELSVVPASLRGFRIGLGLDVRSHVLVFGTLDNIFTVGLLRRLLDPYWFSSQCPLKVYHPDVYVEWHDFLSFMSAKVKDEARRHFTSSVLAIDWVRTNVGGVGIYMSEEVFHYAGIPTFLKLGEFLRCPSRVARFCEAFWTLAARARSKMQCRMRYADWLCVHAKKQVLVSKRWKRQWEDSQVGRQCLSVHRL
ncbi:hypothetical protein FKP32DRAFT_1576005 [Trametes sanguinea]|nr:hypothetical protein FKP32DRAFT_1576005 [Trametes sanguinea]